VRDRVLRSTGGARRGEKDALKKRPRIRGRGTVGDANTGKKWQGGGETGNRREVALNRGVQSK